MLAEIRSQHPEESTEEHLLRLKYRRKHLKRAHIKKAVKPLRWWLLISGLLFMAALIARAQEQQPHIDLSRIGGVLQSGDNIVDTVNHAFKVNIVASSGLTVTASGNLGRSWTLSSATDSVNVGNFPASYAVTGTFYQTTQPVSGVFYQTVQPISGTVITNPAPPPLSAKDMGNPLLYKAAMRVYCQTNLNGCGK